MYKSKIEQVLDRCLNGREIVIWGNPSRLLLRSLKGYKYTTAGEIDVRKHYVILVNGEDESDFHMDGQSADFSFPNDYFLYGDDDMGLPFEWECHGVKVGKMTYFGDIYTKGCKYGYIESIGSYTSINSTAAINIDHQMSMIFTSDDITDIFTEENQALFDNKKKSDPKHPYAINKNRVKIGNDVYICTNSFINASKVVSIGDGAIIAAGAVVLEDVPPYAVVAGVPAKVKRYRFPPEMIEALLRVKWWDWSVDKINENADALVSPEIFMQRFAH